MSDQAALGWQNPGDFGSGFNSQIFLIWSILSRIAGSTLVEVMGVNDAAGTVDIHPLVNQVDGYGNAIPHGTIYGCPYFQLQSGTSAVIIPPTVGDIGIALFADRDMSSVIANRKQSNPGSNRMFDHADGMYLGGALNVTPTQFVQFNAAGITITSPVSVTVNAPVVAVNAATSATVTSPSIALKNTGAALHKLLNGLFSTWAAGHVHSNGNGGANTGVPTTLPDASMQTTTTQAE